jgi:hypothetical protein
VNLSVWGNALPRTLKLVPERAEAPIASVQNRLFLAYRADLATASRHAPSPPRREER